jgi:SAM-dependent methyltransferase
MKSIPELWRQFKQSPFVYEVLRKLLVGGVRKKPILRALDLAPGDHIIDIGCGTGEFLSAVTPDMRYTGIDLDEAYLKIAESRRAGRSNITLQRADVNAFDFKPYTTGMLIGVLHHLPPREQEQLLSTLQRSSLKRLVILDSVLSRWHLINNLLCRVDNGRFITTYEAELALLKRFFLNLTGQTYYSPNGMARYALFVMERK